MNEERKEVARGTGTEKEKLPKKERKDSKTLKLDSMRWKQR